MSIDQRKGEKKNETKQKKQPNAGRGAGRKAQALAYNTLRRAANAKRRVERARKQREAHQRHLARRASDHKPARGTARRQRRLAAGITRV